MSLSYSNSADSSCISAKMRRPWEHLPAELVTLISEKASTTVVQYVHLRAVCKAWRAALTPSPRHLPRQAPWLVLPRLSDKLRREFGIDESELSFYDLSQSKIHQFKLPYLTGKYLNASGYGWLVLENDQRVSLHNPITRSTIDHLPPFDAPPTILKAATSERNRSDVQCYQQCVTKVVLSCSPSEPGCAVVVWFSIASNWELGFCRIGDSQWTVLKMRDTGPCLLDFTWHNNSVYTVNVKKEVFVYDLHSLAVTMFTKIRFTMYHERINLVEGDAESGGPFVVKRPKHPYNRRAPDQIHVYKWLSDQKRWRLVRDIGKRVMFLSEHHCSIMQLENEQGNEMYCEMLKYIRDAFHVDINRVHIKSGVVVPHYPNPIAVLAGIRGLSSWFTPSVI